MVRRVKGKAHPTYERSVPDGQHDYSYTMQPRTHTSLSLKLSLCGKGNLTIRDTIAIRQWPSEMPCEAAILRVTDVGTRSQDLQAARAVLRGRYCAV